MIGITSAFITTLRLWWIDGGCNITDANAVAGKVGRAECRLSRVRPAKNAGVRWRKVLCFIAILCRTTGLQNGRSVKVCLFRSMSASAATKDRPVQPSASVPLKYPCPAPGCNALSDSPGRCQQHRSEAYRQQDERRGSRQSRGYDRAHEKLRAAVLASEPLCRICSREGRITLATDLDHIVPIRVAPGRRLDIENVQPTCGPCNQRKRAEDARKWPGVLLENKYR
jgi:5-methylcytosine-specific restriction enzyme A